MYNIKKHPKSEVWRSAAPPAALSSPTLLMLSRDVSTLKQNLLIEIAESSIKKSLYFIGRKQPVPDSEMV